MATTIKIQGNLKFGPHKSYYGVATYDDEAGIFHGQVIGLRDVVTFQGASVKELSRAFTESVDDYLDFCKQRGEEPEKPYSGKFVTRISPSLHKKLNRAAQLRQQSLNTYIETILRKAVERTRDGGQLRGSAKKRVLQVRGGVVERRVKK